MLPLLLLKGSLIGLSISIPMGPNGMLCLRYSLARGRAFGISSGLGIAFAEASAVALTATLLGSITTFIENNQNWLLLIGSFFLFYFGLLTLQSRQKEERTEVSAASHFKVFFKMFALTITNPLTLLSFVAIFSAVGIETLENDLFAVGLLSAGVFLGSIAWWTAVSSSSSYILGKIRSSSAHVINKIVGFAILGISVYSFFSALRSLIA